MERIVNDGNSELLFNLASKVKGIEPSKPMIHSGEPNVCIMTEVAKREGEKIINDDADLLDVEGDVKFIKVNSLACNDKDITDIDLILYKNLKELTVGKNALEYVTGLELKGFANLEMVDIGAGSFSQGSDGVFEATDCRKLKTVTIGDGCFSKCAVVIFKGKNIT